MPIMRSGFLNVSSPASPSSSSSPQDKGSRNKRKFWTDQQQSCLPLPTPVCNGDGSRNVVNGIESGSSWTMDCRSLGVGDAAADSIENTACCSTETYNMHPDHLNSVKSSIAGNIRFPNYCMKVTDCSSGFQQSPCCTDHQEYEELREPDWDQYSEGQLEEMLMNVMDTLYKDAIKRITAFDYGQEDALNAVLRNGRWNGRDAGRDALTSIVENSLAWLRTPEGRWEMREPAFSDLKEMESYVLAEMVCMLRKVRPFLSKGDAMWCLLMCDMNVLACASEDDVVHSSVKDVSSPAAASLPPKGVSGPPLSDVPASGVPLPQQTPYPSQALVQPSSSLVNSYKDSHSAFSPPRFSSSPVGKVAVACRKGNPEKSYVSRISQAPTSLLNGRAGNVMQEQKLQAGNNASSHQFPPISSPTEEHTTKLGAFASECTSGGQYLSKLHNLKADHVACDVNTTKVCSVPVRDKQMAQVPGSRHASHAFETTITSSLSEFSASEATVQPDFTAGRLQCGENFGPIVQLPGDVKEPVQTDLHIGNTTSFPGFQPLLTEAWTDSAACDNVNKLLSSRTELSLATASAASASTEISSVNYCEEESSVNGSLPNVSINQILGCTEVDGEEGRTDVLWQLVDRVKDLEVQLQEWTEWAQQKVMQAARRLSKDTAELKALRLEREEYMRLKKEKQALEESTMKKLSEMENALRKALNQVDRANTTARRLEAENAEVRAEMEAAKLTAAESVSVCQEATKREKKSSKKAQTWEKQKMKLQEELAEEKRKLTSLLQQLSQAKERLQQAEVRWRQEKKVKEEALAHADSEKRAKEQVEQSAKRREEALQRKSELESQKYRDEIQKLECEIARVKISSGLQPSMLRWENGSGNSSDNLDTCTIEKLKRMNGRLLSEIADLQDSQKDIHRDRECVMCMSEEMSVVFLPCAHQVVCIKCNDLHEKQGLRDCPSCRTPIKRRIRVYGVKS